MTHKTYPYRPQLGMVLFGILFFGTGGIFFVHLARDGRGLVLYRLIELGPTGAMWFHGTLAVLAFTLVAGGLWGLWLRLTSKQELHITDQWIEVPVSRWSRETRRIDFNQITGIQETTISGTKTITLFHSNGKSTVNNRMLPSNSDYEDIKDAVTRQRPRGA